MGGSGKATTTVTQAPSPVTATAAPVEYVTGNKAHAASSLSFTAREIEAFGNYTGAMYKTVNPRLRAGKSVSSDDKEDLAIMDKAFAKASLSQAVTVYRGLAPEIASKLTVGSSFKDGGFTSTSTDKDIGRMYTNIGGGGSALMEIRVPKGAKAISVKSASQFTKENEILLNRGSSFRVVGEKAATRLRPRTLIVEMV